MRNEITKLSNGMFRRYSSHPVATQVIEKATVRDALSDIPLLPSTSHG